MIKPQEFISFRNMIGGAAELVISQISVAEEMPYDDKPGEDLYSISLWRPGKDKEFTYSYSFLERLKAIWNIIFLGRVSSKRIILGKSQLQKLSSWIYLHDDYPEDSNDYIPTSKG